MKEEYIKRYSHALGFDTQMLVFGHSGYPLILFPTSKGRYYENKDFKLIESVSWFVETGKIRIYCPDSIDELSWYNKNIHPAARAYNHTRYDQMIHQELVPYAKYQCNSDKVAVAGASFGAYHATNFAFRHPETVSHLFNMGGAYDIRPQLDGYFDDTCYYNNPVDYLLNADNPYLWQLKIALGVGEDDFCKPANIRLAQILSQKNMKHWLDIRAGQTHDWPAWREMLPTYISQM